MRVAALADVHGNAPALEAVLRDVAEEHVDGLVFCGDLTWGPLPEDTIELVRSLALPVRFVRGNAERALLESTDERAVWLRERHGREGLELVERCEPTLVVDVEGLGPVLFCHGSPRSDEELVTERTPAERVRAFLAGIAERVVVTAHTHVRYDRVVDGVRLLNPGSVRMPYEGDAAAFWAVLGPDVEFRRTAYDVERTLEAMRASGDPRAEQTVQVMLDPPTRDEAIEHAEHLVFSG